MDLIDEKQALEMIKAINEAGGLKGISKQTYMLILDEHSHDNVINILLKTLKKEDPNNATQEYAEKVLKVMRKVAKMELSNS